MLLLGCGSEHANTSNTDDLWLPVFRNTDGVAECNYANFSDQYLFDEWIPFSGCSFFRNDYALVRKTLDGVSEWEIVDLQGKIVPINSDHTVVSWTGIHLVLQDSRGKYFIRNGVRGSDSQEAYDDYVQVHESVVTKGREWIAVKKGDKWGYIDSDLDTVIPFQYDLAQPFQHGAALVEDPTGRHLIKPDGKEVTKRRFFKLYALGPEQKAVAEDRRGNQYIVDINGHVTNVPDGIEITGTFSQGLAPAGLPWET